MKATTLFLLLALLLAGCRREEAAPAALATATITPTPFSTALPPLPTEIAPGSQEDRPLQMLVYARDNRATRDAVEGLQAALLERGLFVEIIAVQRYAEALAALCASGAGQVSVAWLDGISYAAARAQNCGTPALQVERDSETGRALEIIVTRDLGITTIASLRQRSFCRISYDDYDTWLAPTLLLRANDLNPLTAFESISDYEDVEALLRAVAGGNCDAAAIPVGTLDDPDYATLAEDVRVVATSAPFPYNVLLLPSAVPLGVRLQLVDALEAVADDETLAGTLRVLVGQDALVTVTELTEFDTFLDSTGLDFAQLGS
ncbi:MAG: PhnD/SsuA/transferrin family substrate-binding protein [Chloroflexi bacterium]|nr:PhnD/SsuA/transferrin family substrate-binding protein [Chloroflexota bacterium]